MRYKEVHWNAASVWLMMIEILYFCELSEIIFAKDCSRNLYLNQISAWDMRFSFVLQSKFLSNWFFSATFKVCMIDWNAHFSL